MAGSASRQRVYTVEYSLANARLLSSVSIRAHSQQDATHGRRLRRGSQLAGELRHD